MRNLKKYLAVIIAVALLATAMVPAFAAPSFKFEAQAETLKKLQLMKGDASGNLLLGSGLTREEGATFAVRLFGAEAAALALDSRKVNETLTSKFADAAKISAWAKPYVAYAASNAFISGRPQKDTAKTIFAPSDALTGKEFAAMILSKLGYTFKFADATLTLADISNLSATDAAAMDSKKLMRDDTAGMMYAALKAAFNGSDDTIFTKLLKNAEFKALAIAAGEYALPTKLEAVADKTIDAGAKLELPAKVKALYADGKAFGDVDVTWDVASVDTTKAGTYTATGKATVEGAALTTTVKVTVNLGVFAATVADPTNIKVIDVTFNKDVDKDTLTKVSLVNKYGTTIATITSLKDGSTKEAALVVTNTNNITLDEKYKVVIEGVKSKVATGETAEEIKAFSKEITLSDRTFPEVTGVKVINPKKFEISASEPINQADINVASVITPVKIDGLIVVGTLKVDNIAKKLTAVLSTALTAGNHDIQILSLGDFAGLKSLNKTFTVAIAEDKVAPKVTKVEYISESKAKVTFDEDLSEIGTFKLENISGSVTAQVFDKDSNNNDIANVVIITSDTTKVKFDKGAIVGMTLYYNGQKDLVDNKVGKSSTDFATFAFKFEDDTAVPTVASAKFDESNNLTITFSKSMNPTAGVITIKADEQSVDYFAVPQTPAKPLFTFKAGTDNKEIYIPCSDHPKLTLFDKNGPDRPAGIKISDSADVTLKGFKDATPRQNVLAEVTKKVSVFDTKLWAPRTVADTTLYGDEAGNWAEDNGHCFRFLVTNGITSDEDTIKFAFYEPMDVSTISNLANYAYATGFSGTRSARSYTGYKLLSQMSGVKVKEVSADGMTVTITFPGARTITNQMIVVSGLKDDNKNTMIDWVSAVASGVNVYEYYRLVNVDTKIVGNAIVAKKNSVKVTFNGLMKNFDPSGLMLVDGSGATYSLFKEATNNIGINSDWTRRTITFTTTKDLPANPTGLKLVATGGVVNGMLTTDAISSYFGKPLAMSTAGIALEDWFTVAPTITATDNAGQIKIAFDEDVVTRTGYKTFKYNLLVTKDSDGSTINLSESNIKFYDKDGNLLTPGTDTSNLQFRYAIITNSDIAAKNITVTFNPIKDLIRDWDSNYLTTVTTKVTTN